MFKTINLTNIIAISISLIFLLFNIFNLQVSLFFGLIFSGILFAVMMLIGFIFSIVTIPISGFKKFSSYLSLIIFMVAITISSLNIGHHLHYFFNKNNLENIDNQSKGANIKRLSNMLRYHKMLNEELVSNHLILKNKEDIENVFGEYIIAENLDIDKIVEIRKKLVEIDIISMERKDDVLVLIIDGFLDNEFGYIKCSSGKIKIGDRLPTDGFEIARLIKLENGWYFFYTT